MILLDEVLMIHRRGIERYGGSDGLRDEALLLSAIGRPFQTFEGKELYPDVFSKAAALLESILINHPFVDGNKRTGFAILMLLLKKEGLVVTADSNALYNLIIAIASGDLRFDGIVKWLNENTAHA